MGYTKLFYELILSTVWREDDKTRLLWITMLALRDQWHKVNASVPGLADAARITISECEHGLKILSSPDQYSRSKAHEGRRILPIDGGWLIVNGEEYKNKMSLDERREYQRIKQKEYYAKRKANKSYLQKSLQSSSNCQFLTHTDTYTEKDIYINTNTDHSKFENGFGSFWKEYPKKIGKGAAEKSWKVLKPSSDLVTKILIAIKAQKASSQWTKDNGQFIPNPATWLNQRRWEDDLSTLHQPSGVELFIARGKKQEPTENEPYVT